jgi:2-hydroxycyclohexanecarboxyl-CoA dehydrogenase
VAAEEVAAAINDSGDRAIAVEVDVTDRAAVDVGAQEVRSHLGRPTILVNSAGKSLHGPFLELTKEAWETIIAINLTGTFNCCQAVIPDMLEEGWGRIVNISSSSIHSGAPRLASYVSAKSGVIGLTKSLALEFASQGITVNTVPPGFVDTPMLRGTAGAGHIDVDAQIERTPVRRIGKPEDIAYACSFLVREEASYITGQIIGVNGGRNT